MAGVAMAGPHCASTEEVSAMRAEIVHEELMNAGLYCQDVDKYNAYQARFSRDRLRLSDSLMHMFRRMYPGARGEDEYHAFTTRVANHHSIRAIQDNARFCHEADLFFEAAMIRDKPSMESFVLGVEVSEPDPVDACSADTEGASLAESVLPLPNPLRLASLGSVPPTMP